MSITTEDAGLCNQIIRNLFHFLNNNLSIVVLTQKIRCKIIPTINKTNKTSHKFHVFEKYVIIYATIIVASTSTIAILNNLYL